MTGAEDMAADNAKAAWEERRRSARQHDGEDMRRRRQMGSTPNNLRAGLPTAPSRCAYPMARDNGAGKWRARAALAASWR